MATLTVYPDAGSGNTTVDGNISRQGQDVAWATIHDAADGTNSQDTGSDQENFCVVGSSSTVDQWAEMHRSIFTFDTSALPDGTVISAAVFSVYVQGKGDFFSDSIALVDTAPANDNAVVATDYTDGVEMGTTLQASVIAIADITTGAYNDWTLNVTGIANIDKTGITRFGLRNESDRSDTEPTWQSNVDARIYGRYADYAGTTYDPKLVITYGTDYTLSATVGSFVLTGIAAILSIGYMLAVTVGTFVLTGVTTIFNKTISIITTVGAFTLTGIATVFNKGWEFAVSAGSYILTGISAIFSGAGSWRVTNQSKSSAISPTNQSQNNISPTGQSKSDTVTFKNQEKS